MLNILDFHKKKNHRILFLSSCNFCEFHVSVKSSIFLCVNLSRENCLVRAA